MNGAEVAESTLRLRREYAGEAIELALHHLSWAARHLAEERDVDAVRAFGRAVLAIRETAPILKQIEAAETEGTALADAAAQYRAQRRPLLGGSG